MTHSITDLDFITEELNPSNAIEVYLWDELTDGNYWSSVDAIARQLETASCANGSWGDMIYTRDIEGKLADSDWVEAIDAALEEYADATGETPDIPNLGFAVTFAVDWTAQALASKLRYLGKVAVVQASVDSCDPKPDVIAFADVAHAEEWVADEVERRVQHRVDQRPHSVSEAERDEWTDDEMSLFNIEVETL